MGFLKELSVVEAEVFIQVIQREPWLSKFTTDEYKTQKICEKNC